MHFSALFTSAALLHLAASRPLLARRDNSAAAKAIIAIAPDTASCDGATFPKECATASQAAPALINAFQIFQISDPHEQAALLSLMLYESGDFKYNRNKVPGVPGQGTRNMQSPDFNRKYAEHLASMGALKQSDLAAATTPDAVLDLLQPDEFSFASAAWFVTTQCGGDVRQGLAAGTQAGYEAYLTGCVGTTADPKRIEGWEAALKVVT